MISVKLEDKAFRRKLDRLRITHSKALARAVSTSTIKMHRYAVHKAPVDDGKLKQGITLNINKTGVIEGNIISNASYSEAVEDGAKPHKIRIKTKKVLAGAKRKAPAGWDNFSRDWAIYGKEVQHPGTTPRPFMYPAWVVGKRYLINEIKKLFK